MGKSYKINYFKANSINNHIFGDLKVGNCALCGEFLGLDSHHRVTRSRGGGDEDLVDVCRDCHRWIENHPLQAAKYRLYIRGYKINKD